MWQGHVQATMGRGLGKHEKDVGMDELHANLAPVYPAPSCVTSGQFGPWFSYLYNRDNDNNIPNFLGC